MYENYDFKSCLAKSKAFFVYMVIVNSIHQVADKSVYWNQAAQTTQFEAILAAAHWSKSLTEMVLLFDQLLKLPKILRNPSDLVCSSNDYILLYKIQKFKCVKMSMHWFIQLVN